MILEWEGGKEGWGWLVSQDSTGEGEECLVRGSVVVEQGEGDWQNIVGQTVEYCCRRLKKKGNVATRVWLGKEGGEQAEAASTSETRVEAEQMDNSRQQAVPGRETSSWKQVVQGKGQVVQGRVTHWVPEQQAGVIQTDEGEVIVSR